MDSSVFFSPISNPFWFFYVFLPHTYIIFLAVILLYLPHDSHLVVEKGGLCYSNCRLRVSDLCRSPLHH